MMDPLGVSFDARVVGGELVTFALDHAKWWNPPHGKPSLAVAGG